MIKAIVFDIGGVIQGLDWSPVVNSLLDIKEDLDIFSYQNAFYYDRKNNFDLYATGKMSKEDFWTMVVSRLGIDKRHAENCSKSTELLYSYVNFDVLELIKSLKGRYKLYVLSNACPEIEKKVVKDNLYVYLFDKLYFSHNIKCKKPDKEAYLHVCKENSLMAGECVFIDNDIKNIRGAEAVGMKGVLYKGTDALKQELYVLLGTSLA